MVIGFQFSRSKEGAQQKGYLRLLSRAVSGLFRKQNDRVSWDSPEGQRSLGRLDVLQETNHRHRHTTRKTLKCWCMSTEGQQSCWRILCARLTGAAEGDGFV